MHVVWAVRDEREIHEALQRLDDRLFLDKEIDPHGRIFYLACYWNGERAPEPRTIVVEGRDPNGAPWPLTERLVGEVQRQMQRGPLDLEAIRRRNEDLKLLRSEQAEESYQEIASEFDRHRAIGNFAIVPRSRGLQLARQRGRRLH